MALFTPEERAATADHVSRLLQSDPRVEGVMTVGSLARQPDRWSDADLAVVVAHDADLEVVASDWVGRLYTTLPVAHHFEVAFAETLVRGFLLRNLLELDLSFDSPETFSVWGPARPTFDRSGHVEAALARPAEPYAPAPEWANRAGFAWHDIVHACAAVRRNRPWQALWYLERVKNLALELAQRRRGFYADFFDYADDLPAEELRALEGALPGSLEPRALLDAIEIATHAFLTELRVGKPEIAARLEGPLGELMRFEDRAT